MQKGHIVAICTSEIKGTAKKPVEKAVLIEDFGIENDAHAGKWHRQVSLLSKEAVDAFSEKAPEISKMLTPGAFGENLLTEGIELNDIPCGSLIRSGEVVLRVTQHGKECHSTCEIRNIVGDCIMPKEGIFTEVVHGGILTVGDELSVEPRSGNSPYRAAVITLSDKASRGEREDKSGPLLAKLLVDCGYEVIEEVILPDDRAQLEKNLIRLADRREAELIITTGGTGFSERDITPEATLAVATRNVPGIAEAIRAESLKITPKAMLSRAVSVIRNRTLIINLPGSPKAVEESFAVIKDVLGHGLGVLTGHDTECGR